MLLYRSLHMGKSDKEEGLDPRLTLVNPCLVALNERVSFHFEFNDGIEMELRVSYAQADRPNSNDNCPRGQEFTAPIPVGPWMEFKWEEERHECMDDRRRSKRGGWPATEWSHDGQISINANGDESVGAHNDTGHLDVAHNGTHETGDVRRPAGQHEFQIGEWNAEQAHENVRGGQIDEENFEISRGFAATPLQQKTSQCDMTWKLEGRA